MQPASQIYKSHKYKDPFVSNPYKTSSLLPAPLIVKSLVHHHTSLALPTQLILIHQSSSSNTSSVTITYPTTNAMSAPNSPFGGLPTSPRAFRTPLEPINTSLRPATSVGTSPYSDSVSEKQSPQSFTDNRQRRRDSMIFVNATIPLSPEASPVMKYEEQPFDGLAPRPRNGLARLFCCFGREERARRRAQRFAEYEKVGEKCHWTEL